MKKTTKKLLLARETLKHLTEVALLRVVGGRKKEVETAHCTETMGETCYTTDVTDTCQTGWVSCDEGCLG